MVEKVSPSTRASSGKLGISASTTRPMLQQAQDGVGGEGLQRRTAENRQHGELQTTLLPVVGARLWLDAAGRAAARRRHAPPHLGAGHVARHCAYSLALCGGSDHEFLRTPRAASHKLLALHAQDKVMAKVRLGMIGTGVAARRLYLPAFQRLGK